MPLDIRLAAEAYAKNTPGARAADRRGTYAVTRFRLPEDSEHPRAFRVPLPEHVARFLLAPPITRAGLTTPSDLTSAAHAILGGFPRRFRGVDGHRAEPRDGTPRRAAPILTLPDWYKGLQAALHFEAADPADPAAFDREAYIDAIIGATLAVVDRDVMATRAAEARANAATEKVARREAARVARGPAKTPAERVALSRARRDAAERDAVRGALAYELEVEPLMPGETITREALFARVSSALSDTDIVLTPRRVASLTLEYASEHGLTERLVPVTVDDVRKRARGFVYTPIAIAVPSEESPVEATDIIIERVVAVLADEVRDRLRAELTARTPSTSPRALPANVTPIRRAA